MKLDSHIAKRFLTDDKFTMEIIDTLHPGEVQNIMNDKPITQRTADVAGYPVEMTEESVRGKIYTTLQLLDTPKGHKPYYCTETMLACLDHMRIHKEGEHYNWTYFNSLQNQTATFIFPNNALLRMQVIDNLMCFFHVSYTPEDKVKGEMYFIMFHLDRKTGVLCDHFGHKDVKDIEKFVYSLLCFVYMADTEEVIVPPGFRYGTRKTGKLINSTPFEMTVINSRWNVTSIRTEGFDVSPHWALYHTGPGRTIPRYVFIDQFQKHGYIRKGKPENFEKVI